MILAFMLCVESGGHISNLAHKTGWYTVRMYVLVISSFLVHLKQRGLLCNPRDPAAHRLCPCRKDEQLTAC